MQVGMPTVRYGRDSAESARGRLTSDGSVLISYFRVTSAMSRTSSANSSSERCGQTRRRRAEIPDRTCSALTKSAAGVIGGGGGQLYSTTLAFPAKRQNARRLMLLSLRNWIVLAQPGGNVYGARLGTRRGLAL